MITGVTHISVLVTDQDKALDFYTNILGLEVHTDAQFDEMRWLTVNPKGNPHFEIALMLIDKDSEDLIHEIAENAPVCVFSTDDCRKEYETLKAKGVEFLDEPTEEEWGVACNFVDPFGNAFHLSQLN